jgi:hypothetical protein
VRKYRASDLEAGGALNPQSPVSPKTPVDIASGHCDSGHLFPELVLQRWRPGDKAEAEPVVDHGETSGGEG